MTHAEIQWRRLDEQATERATISYDDGAPVLTGVVDGATNDGRLYSLRYTVRCARDWSTRDAAVNGRIGETPVSILVSRNPDTGVWTRNGLQQQQIDNCVDVDLGFSPITNTLPIRRLALGVGAAATVRAAWLRFPDLEFQVLEQRYERVGDSTYIYESAGGRFRAELEVDRTGIVLRYGDYWVGSVTLRTV